MSPRTYVARSALDLADTLDGQDQLENGLAAVRYPSLLESGLSAVRNVAAKFTPLPIVVSPQPQALTVPSIPSEPQVPPQPPNVQAVGGEGAHLPSSPMPSAPVDGGVAAPPSAPSGGTPAAMPTGQPTGPAPQPGGDLHAHARAVAQRYGLDPDVFERQITQESGWNPQAVSPAGAKGLGQFMPGTAASYGLTDPFDPYASLDAAARHMADNLKANGGDYARALAAYNAGQGAVDKYGGVPPFPETQSYIQIILGPGRSAPTAVAPPSATAAPPAPPAAGSSPQAASGSGGGDTVTIEHIDDHRRLTIPRANLSGYMQSPAPGVPVMWRVVDDQRQSMSNTAEWSPDSPGTAPSVAQASTGRSGGGVMSRQPLSSTMGPDTATGDEYDPRDADQGAHEWSPPTPPLGHNSDLTPEPPSVLSADGNGGSSTAASGYAASPDSSYGTASDDPGQQPYQPTYGPPLSEAGPEQPSAAPESPLKPLYDLTGSVVGYVQDRVGQTLGAAPSVARRALERATGPLSAASTAAQESYADPVMQMMPAPARAVKIVSDTAEAYGDAAARRVAAELGVSDEELFSILGHPVSGQDIAGFSGGQLLDPLSYVGAGEADPLLAVGKGLARDALPAVRGVGSRIRGALSANAANVAAADARMAEQGGTSALGTLGVAPEPRRMYHGTAEAFPQPDPSKFDPQGLYGPGYYLTDNPEVASSYASARNFTPGGITPKPELRSRRLSDEIAQTQRQLENPRLSAEDRTWLQGSLERAQAELDRVTSQGPNVRAVDVPEDVRLIQIDRPLREQPGLADSIAQGISDPVVARRFDGAMRSQAARERLGPLMGDDVWQALESAYGDGRLPTRDMYGQMHADLQAAGIDGLSHQGGQIRPLMDANGQPVEHRVTVIFPGGLGKIRNAFSGEVGGATLGPSPGIPGAGLGTRLAADIGSSAGSGVMGAAIGAGAPAETDEERRRNALIGAGVGMVAGPLASRAMRRGEGGALATLGASPGARPPRESPLNPITGYRRTAPVEDLTQSADPQTRRLARMMEGQYHGPTIPDDRSLVQRIGDGYVRAMTDDRNMIDNFARSAAESAGVSPGSVRGAQETLTQLTRVNGASVANQRLDEGFRKGLSIVAGDKPAEQALPIYLTHRHNIDVAVEAGEKVKREILDAPEPASITRSREAADRAHAAGNTAVADRLDARVSQWEQARDGRAQAAADRVMEGRDFSGDLNLNDTQQALIRLQEQIGPERWQKVTAAADEIYRFNRETLDRQVQAGRVPADLAEHLKERYPHYVRTDIADYFEGGPSGPAPSGRVMGISDIGIKPISLAGTTKDRVNPLLSTIDATHAAEAAIQRNTAGQEFVRLRDAAPEWQGVFKEVGPEKETVQTAAAASGGSQRALRGGEGPAALSAPGEPSSTAIARQADTYPRTAEPTGTGLAVPDQGRSGAIPAPPDPTRVPSDYKLRNGEQFLTVFKDGKPRTFVVPKEYAPLVMPKAAPILADSGAANVFRWWLNTYKSLLTSKNPGFSLVVSPLRDFGDYATREMTLSAQSGGARGAGQAIKALPGIIKDYAQALPSSFEGFAQGVYKGDLAEMMRAGAGQTGRPMRDEKQLRAALADLKRPNVFTLQSQADARRFAMNVLTLGAEPIGNRLEQVPRLAAARRAAARGESGVEQAMRFRDATVDFQRGGWASRVANQVIPFFNVAMQSSAQIARTAKANPTAFAAAVGTTVGLPVLAAEAWNRSDEQRARDYEDVPQYLKDSGIVFMLPGMEGRDERGDRRPGYVWIPLGAGASLAIPMREIAATAMGGDTRLGDPNRWGELALAMGMQFSPVRGDSAGAAVSSLMPVPGTSTIAELTANKDLYRGTTIATDRADERATPLSHAIASGLNAVTGREDRPSQVEYALRDVGGTLANTALGASDLVAGRTKQEDRPVANTPIVGGTVGRIIRDTGGQRLTNAQDEDRRLPESVRTALQQAGMRRDEVLPVPSRYRGAGLTRAEQERWQILTNREIGRAVGEVRRSSEWRDRDADKKALIQQAISDAKNAAAERARLPDDAEIERRIERERRRKAS